MLPVRLVSVSDASFVYVFTDDNSGIFIPTVDHYSQYFMRATKDDTKSTSHSAYMMFNQSQSLGAYKSLIDTIVMELIFPDSEYELHVLYACLREALDEQPRRSSRFDQRLFDALGDLAVRCRFLLSYCSILRFISNLSAQVTSQALDLVETPLSGSDGRDWKESTPQTTEEFDQYLQAEYISVDAARDVAGLKDLISPLERIKNQAVVDELWKLVNLVRRSRRLAIILLN